MIKYINIANAAILPRTEPMTTPTFCFEDELGDSEIIVEALPTFRPGFPTYLSNKHKLKNK